MSLRPGSAALRTVVVTGFFGQNVPYPGAQSTSSFIASTLMIIIFAWYSSSSSNAKDGCDDTAEHAP